VNDGPRWGEYLDRDLLTMIDATYRTLRSPASRAIGGLSMGGYGALYHAFTHPDLYGVVGAHSPSLHSDPSQVPFLGQGEQFNEVDPVFLAGYSVNLTKLQIWIDIGKDDEAWLARTTELHNVLLYRGIPHTWQLLPGAHDYDYWTGNMLAYVRFYGHALAGQ
jgi:enterochelin esterase-like enzyme